MSELIGKLAYIKSGCGGGDVVLGFNEGIEFPDLSRERCDRCPLAYRCKKIIPEGSKIVEGAIINSDGWYIDEIENRALCMKRVHDEE